MAASAKFNKIVTLAIIVFYIDYANGAASAGDLREAGKMMRDVCMPRFKSVTTEVADKISNRVFPDTRDAKCYVNCVLDMMGVVRKGKLNIEVVTKQIEMILPPDMRDHYHRGTELCKDTAKGIKDYCEASYAVLKCYESNVPDFYFP